MDTIQDAQNDVSAEFKHGTVTIRETGMGDDESVRISIDSLPRLISVLDIYLDAWKRGESSYEIDE